LKCKDSTGDTYAVKVIRAVERYSDSARIEVDILNELRKVGGCQQGIVYLKEWFIHEDTEALERAERRAIKRYGNDKSIRKFEYRNMCLVFETLGKSLFDFIKDNKYKGFELS